MGIVMQKNFCIILMLIWTFDTFPISLIRLGFFYFLTLLAIPTQKKAEPVYWIYKFNKLTWIWLSKLLTGHEFGHQIFLPKENLAIKYSYQTWIFSLVKAPSVSPILWIQRHTRGFGWDIIIRPRTTTDICFKNIPNFS